MNNNNNYNDEETSSLTSEESHEPYFNTHTGSILTAREAWTLLAPHDDRYRAKLEGRHNKKGRHIQDNHRDHPTNNEVVHEDDIAAQPSNDEISLVSLEPSQSTIDRALHPEIFYSPQNKSSSTTNFEYGDNDYDDEGETDPDILRAQAMALAAANGQKLTPEQIALIARPDVQQQKLIEETRKAKRQSQTTSMGISGIGADIKKFIEGEKKEKNVSLQWGSDLGKFWEEQSLKLQGAAAGGTTNSNSASGVHLESGKKKMEGFGSDPPPLEKEDEIRLSAVVWKRRSGLGKHSTIKAWEKRRVELRGSQLLYYETPEEARGETSVIESSTDRSPPIVVPTTPKRSLFEQAAQNAEQTIQKTREEISRMAQTVGLEALKPINEARGSLDIVKENASIGASMGHSGSPTPFCLSIKVKSETKWKFCFESHGMLMEWLVALNDVVVRSSVEVANEVEEAGCHWDMQEYSLKVTNNGDHGDDSHDSSPIVSRSFSRQSTNNDTSRTMSGTADATLTQLHLKIIFATSNLAIILSRSSMLSIERWWSLLVFFNFGMWQFYKSTIRSSQTIDRAKPQDKSISLGTPTKKSRSNATAGSSCIKVKNVGDSNTTESGTKLPTWLPISSCDMEVRSRGYLTTKKKIASPGELYECIAVDCFQSESRCSEMALRVVLPKIEFKDSCDKRWKAPDLFVVSSQL